MSNLIVLKISWKDDTRRFRVPYDIPFQRLREEVAQKFALADFRLKYIDEENELITVASDRELHEAIEYLREVDPRKIVRFFVRTADDASTEVTQSVLGNISMYDSSRSQFSQFGTPLGPPHMSSHNPPPPQSWNVQPPAPPTQPSFKSQPNYGSYGSQNGPQQYNPQSYDSGAYPPNHPNPNPNAHQSNPNPLLPHAGAPHQPNTGSQGQQYPGDYRRPPWNPPPQEQEPAELANNYRHEAPKQAPQKPENNELGPGFLRPPVGRKSGEKQYDLRFVRDRELPDGTEVNPGQKVTKVWTVRNTGEAAWPPGTILEWQSGDKLGVDRVAVPEAEPGQDVDIEMEIVAPHKSGHYTGHYRTVLQNGQTFGNRVWIDFVVKG